MSQTDSEARLYTSRRMAIVNAIAKKLSTNPMSSLDGRTIPFFSKLKFFSDLNDLPCGCITAGQETRQYQAGGYKDRYLNITIHIFINQENPLEVCEGLIEDIETFLEINARLLYTNKDGSTSNIKDITIMSISTDEGTLDPISVGEMSLQIHY